MRKTVVLDFDGVIHEYKSRWISPGIISDGPVEGVSRFISELRANNYKVVVVSARFKSNEGKNAVKEWLAENKIFVDELSVEKPPAIVYIDDRAICFNGTFDGLIEKIKNFQPWMKKAVNVSNKTKICTKCGNKVLNEKDNFCVKCGTRLINPKEKSLYKMTLFADEKYSKNIEMTYEEAKIVNRVLTKLNKDKASWCGGCYIDF